MEFPEEARAVSTHHSLLDLTGLGRLKDRLLALGELDATPLMLSWMRIMDDDNRKGILAGTDKDGVPLARVTYRPKTPGGVPLTPEQRLRQRKNLRKGRLAGFGPWVSGLHNNISSSEYRLLGGPPLAPRGRYSRVITNFVTDFDGEPGDKQWIALGAWENVVSPKGVAFLRFHFNGEGQIRRDLRGVRPEGLARARAAMRSWVISEIRQHGTNA